MEKVSNQKSVFQRFDAKRVKGMSDLVDRPNAREQEVRRLCDHIAMVHLMAPNRLLVDTAVTEGRRQKASVLFTETGL